MDKIRVEEAPEDVYPLCPSCKRELRDLWTRTVRVGLLDTQTFLLCPHCHVYLGPKPI